MKENHESELKEGTAQIGYEKTRSRIGAPSNCYDLVVIGAGPAGLFSAINSCPDKREDQGNLASKKILVLEKKPTPGRKLLISGSSQCNLTHDGDINAFLRHYGDHGRFLRPALLGFTNQDLIDYFKTRGLDMISEPGGKIFPRTRKARDVLNILIEECRRSGIEIRCQQEVRSVSMELDGFRICGNDREYSSPLLVIATGGCSYPATGSAGDGYRFARALGHSITDIGPALTTLIIKDWPFSDLAGISLPDMKISLYHNQKKTGENTGDLLFTHEGLSGPGILDLSRYIRAGDTLKLSILPGESIAALDEWLVELSRQEGSRTVKSTLLSLPHSVLPLPARLIARIMEISGINGETVLSQLPRSARRCLVENLVALPLAVERLGGFDAAMATRGGVDLKEVNSRTMESKLVPGLYLAGEVLDADGDTGGYNLQSCFSTGMLAGRSIKRRWGGEGGAEKELGR